MGPFLLVIFNSISYDFTSLCFFKKDGFERSFLTSHFDDFYRMTLKKKVSAEEIL